MDSATLRVKADEQFEAWLKNHQASSDEEQAAEYRRIVVANLNSSEKPATSWLKRLFLKTN